MTDAQFEAFMSRLDRAFDADTRGTTYIGGLYALARRPARSSLQADHTADTEFHRYNNEWTGD